MLESISIKNIALIQSGQLEFGKGLNVLTGETGAGKSLVIDALSLLLGEKADKTLISKGQSQAWVEAVFRLDDPLFDALKDEFDLEENVLVVKRKLTTDGKNECRINGSVATISMLKRLMAPLMDLHGQFDHQNLLKVQSHIKILDMFDSKNIKPRLEAYQKCLSEYNAILRELEEFEIDDAQRNRMLDLYKYQIDEIDAAGFKVGEEEELRAFRDQVMHQEKLMSAVQTAISTMEGDGYDSAGVVSQLKKAGSLLGSVSGYYPKLDAFAERIENAKIEIDDIVSSLQSEAESMEFDEGKAQENEQRLDLLSSLKKKYGSTIEEIEAYRDKVFADYSKIINAEERIAELKGLIADKEKELLSAASELSKARAAAKLVFEQKVKRELADLGMKSANFVVSMEKLDLKDRTSLGLDRVEFMFCANLGQDLKPLRAVASGGEMSRFMLAVKNVTAELEGINTLIFDEIDTGVSGQMALTLAKKLKQVSKVAQVICVTHLAQIASFGDNHLFIEKFEKDGQTFTSVRKIQGEERTREIARLISGNITEHSYAHAIEMLKMGKL